MLEPLALWQHTVVSAMSKGMLRLLIQTHSNDLDLLGQGLCPLLDDSPLPPFHTETVIVPNVGIAKWLRYRIAATLGIAADVDMVLGSRYFQDLIGQLAGEGARLPTDHDVLAWRLASLLPSQLELPVFAPLARYLDGQVGDRALFALADRLAELYQRYYLLRPDWLLSWEQDRQLADGIRVPAWQPALWRELVRQLENAGPGTRQGAACLFHARNRLADTQQAIDLPARLSLFATGTLPPPYLQFVVALARRIDVHLFHLNPCEEFWGDVVDERTMARWRIAEPQRAALSEVGHPLLAAWHRQGREQFELLLEHGEGELRQQYREVTTPGVLGEIQSGILRLDPGPSGRLDPGDESLLFSTSASPLREVEALHDHLLHCFASMPGLVPRDVQVLVPDIDLFAPLVQAVFGELAGDTRYIPFAVADSSQLEEAPVLGALLDLLRQSESRFEASSVLGLLAVPAIHHRFSLSVADVDTIHRWIAESGIRWGLPGAMRPEVPDPGSFAWSVGLERLLLGVALDDDSSYRGRVPFAAAQGQCAELAGAMVEFVESLRELALSLRRARSLPAWQSKVNDLIDRFFAADTAAELELAMVRDALAELCALSERAGFVDELDCDTLCYLLQQHLLQETQSRQYLNGTVTVARLTAQRTVPARVVCLLGLNAGAFPRQGQAPAWDMVDAHPRPGDSSRRDDDRALFLDTLLSAGEQIYLSWTGSDERSDVVREPSLLVSELRAFIDRQWRSDTVSSSDSLLREHPLKPFSPAYFCAEGRLFSYRREWLPAAAPAAAVEFLSASLEPLSTRVIEWTQLRQFYRNPCRGFFVQRLGVRFDAAEAPLPSCEPQELNALEKWQLKQQILAASWSREGLGPLRARLHGTGKLPVGRAGERLLEQAMASSRGQRQIMLAQLDAPPRSIALDLRLEDYRLLGVFEGLRGDRYLQLRSGKFDGRELLSFWLSHLALCAAAVQPASSMLLAENKSVVLDPIEQQRAGSLLLDLLDIYSGGLDRPMPLFPKAGWAYAEQLHRGKTAQTALGAANRAYRSTERSRGEESDPYVARVFDDPGAALGDEFCQLAERVFLPAAALIRVESISADA